MARVLEVKNRTERTIYLTDERYKHITKHPEMQNSIHLIEQTIKNPQKITEYSLDPDIRFYYSYHKNRESKARYLRAVVILKQENNFHKVFLFGIWKTTKSGSHSLVVLP